MRNNCTSVLNLMEYLQQLKLCSSDKNFDVDQFIHEHIRGQPFIYNSPHVVFVLDYRSGDYYYLSENVKALTGLSHNTFLQEGISFTLYNMHAQDLDIYANKIFSSRLDFMHSVSEEENTCYWYNHNYRFLCADKQYKQVLQQYKVLQQDETGNPLVIMGYCTDISLYKHDDRIADTIYCSGYDNTNKMIRQTFYYPDANSIVFSKREVEILKWLIEGLSSHHIAGKLYISPHTVNTHRRNMLEKAHAKNTADLIRYAVTNNCL